jgi:pimeloyl-ACP methyl ester carboxylesterase
VLSGSDMAAAKAAGYSSDFEVHTYFLHDVPQDVLRDGPEPQREQTEAIFEQPCQFAQWPRIPTRIIASAQDRFFPLEFQRQVAKERLQAEIEVIPGGHLVALSRPKELTETLIASQGLLVAPQ